LDTNQISSQKTAPLLHSIQSAAARLNVGRTLLYQLLAEGVLPSVTIGKRRLVAEADLEEYVERLRAQQATPS
jgi:excisionase family DNA binding protein